MHARFADLRHDLVRVDGNAFQVFVPVGLTGKALIQLLIVGQATRGWDEPELGDYGTAAQCAANLVAKRSFNSGYWQVAERLARSIYVELGSPFPEGGLPQAIGWGNLVKVGHPARNPRSSSWRMQAELCVEQLRHEVAEMNPLAIVLMTRDFASQEILLPVFGADGWTNDVPEMDRVAWKLELVPVVWMNHPRNMGPAGYREASIRTATDVICSYLSTRIRSTRAAVEARRADK